jgi:23S rRNA pseudouridine1911/1915/1917 synthase
MPFIQKSFLTQKKEKAIFFIEKKLQLNTKESQRLFARGRVLNDTNSALTVQDFVEKNQEIKVLLFEPRSKNLKPFFENIDFAVFNKPSGVLVHPTSKFTEYSLLDEIRFLYGKNANLVHRLDIETSGTILVSKNKNSEKILKNMFETRQVTKKYLAIVRGKLSKNREIETYLIPLKEIKKTQNNEEIKTSIVTTEFNKTDKSILKKEKKAVTIIQPIYYDSVKNQTMVRAIPITGRRHQIRVHLEHINHSIVGDSIYGVSQKIRDLYLTKQLSDSDRNKFLDYNRLLLHSEILEFKYKNSIFYFKSLFNF